MGNLLASWVMGIEGKLLRRAAKGSLAQGVVVC